MKLTVGPMPSAVYWRRRALVLGAVLVVVLLIAYSCSDGSADDKDKNGRNSGSGAGQPAASGSPSAPPVVSPTGPEPSYTPPVYGGGAGTASSTALPGNAAPGTLCADSEMAVVPVLETSPISRGAPTKLFIRIKNISARTCVRDLGAKMQELYIERDTTRQWSSDACEDRGSAANLVTFPPSHEVSYWVTWDGTANASGCTSPQLVAAGSYRLLGRLGTKISDPVAFQVT